MRASVPVRVPASAATLGAGFACVGDAVGRWLRLSARRASAREAAAATAAPVTLERAGTLGALAVPADEDWLYRGFAAVCRRAGQPVPPGLVLAADSEIPVARGLGSSAAAAVAGAVAATKLLGLALDAHAVAAVPTELERHPDNVAAATLGGATPLGPGPDGGIRTTLAVHVSAAFPYPL